MFTTNFPATNVEYNLHNVLRKFRVMETVNCTKLSVYGEKSSTAPGALHFDLHVCLCKQISKFKKNVSQIDR